MLLVQSNLARAFGPVKKLCAELVFEKKNRNKLGGVEAKWYKARNCYRVWLLARLPEKGKDGRRFIATKEQAEKFIFQTKRGGSGMRKLATTEIKEEEKNNVEETRRKDCTDYGRLARHRCCNR
jgi:hypothetical protein